MKKLIIYILLFVLIVFLFAACGKLPVEHTDSTTLEQQQQTQPTTQPTQPTTTPSQPVQTVPSPPKLPEGTPLAAEELKWFEAQFFWSEQKFDGDTVLHNIRNMFLSTEYASIEEIHLRELFREGVHRVERGTHEETVAVYAIMFDDWPVENGYPVDVYRIPRQEMEAAFLENTGLTIDQTKKNGLEELEYLKEYDSYYDSHTDTTYTFYTMLDGVRLEDGSVVLLYKDKLSRPADEWVVTLKPNGETYWFVSNLPCSG